MPNISTSNKNQIYKYICTLQAIFENDKLSFFADSFRIKTITIDYDYDKHNFPLIYLTMAIPREDKDRLIELANSTTMIFTLQKYIENSDMPGLRVDVIKEECIYFIAPNTDTKDYIDNKDDEIITIGLCAVKHINRNKTAINGVLQNTSMSSGLCYILNGQELLLEPLTYNPKFDCLIIPPVQSTSKAIKYMNNISTFYNTLYRFFMDFDITYLISSSGKGVKKKGEHINLIKINVYTEYDEASMEGLKEDKENGMYIIDTVFENVAFSNTNAISMSYTDIKAVSTTGNQDKEKIASGESKLPINSNTSLFRAPNGNTNLVKTKQSNINNSATQFSFIKNKMDGSIFTINKKYILAVPDNEIYRETYEGEYLLVHKREIYAQEGQGLAMSTMLSFKKIQTEV